MPSITQLVQQLDTMFVDEPPVTITEGGMIREGVSKELDELHQIAHGGKEWILGYQEQEKKRTGITNLKVKFNKVFGYFIEVSSSHLSKVPETYIRKQTITNGERFITPELKEYEEKVLGAEEKIHKIEYEIFETARQDIVHHCAEIQQIAEEVATLDILSSFAETAAKQYFVCPQITEKRELLITNGRHPVVESITGDFVSNDTNLHNKESFVLLTGPNMAGKSTYLRQNAIIVLLAQIGCFVPAESATIGIVDRIFTRIGASDNLAAGESTFLVEMQEASHILHHATSRSLVILDEVGRGTSTYDGMSLAWAISEHIAKQTKSLTFFATHYHELTELESKITSVKNYSVAVTENDSGVIFLHKIIPGGVDKSYGVEVAKLAGLPKNVILRAREILQDLESKKTETNTQISLFSSFPSPLEETTPPVSKTEEKLKDLDINSITPMEALRILEEWQKEI